MEHQTKRGKTKKKKLEIITTDNFPKVKSDIKPEILLAQRIPCRKIFHSKHISYHF